jgi:crotonobetainyl-CoA:carnitine CoA-transferase CaiB-like acyl-CoA transferase
MALPLAGIRGLNFCSYIAGPYCPTLLADLGAEVVKIESHRGDQTRYFPSTLKGETRMFLGVNRNKKGLVLDLKHAAPREIVYKLTQTADVVVETFRPGVADRLQIGYEHLSAVNPRLIYCAISGYGSRGPMRHRPGFEQVLQAMTGIAVSQGGDGPPQVQGGSVVDYYTATLAAFGVMTALFVRERTGLGQKVEALAMVTHLKHPTVGGMRALRVPINFSTMSNRMQQPAPDPRATYGGNPPELGVYGRAVG